MTARALNFCYIPNADSQWSPWLKSARTLFSTQKDIFGCWSLASCGLLNCSQKCIKNAPHVMVMLHHTFCACAVTVWHCFCWFEQCHGDMGTNTQSLVSLCFLQLVVIHHSQINVLFWLFVLQTSFVWLWHRQTRHCHNVTAVIFVTLIYKIISKWKANCICYISSCLNTTDLIAQVFCK